MGAVLPRHRCVAHWMLSMNETGFVEVRKEMLMVVVLESALLDGWAVVGEVVVVVVVVE